MPKHDKLHKTIKNALLFIKTGTLENGTTSPKLAF